VKTFKLLQRFLSYLDPYRRLLTGTIVLVTLWTVINFIPPWLIKILIDDALPRQDLWLLNIIVFVEVAIVLNHQFMSAVKGFLFTYLEQRIYLDMNIRLFDHLMTLPIQYFNTNDTGGLVHRFMQDLMQIRDLLGKWVVDLAVNLMMFVLLAVILFCINGRLAAICVTLAFVYGLNANLFKNRIYGTARDIGERTGELYGLLYQIIPGCREIKALGLSRYMKAIYAEGLVRFFRAQMRNYRLSVYVSFIAETLPYLGWAVIVAIGGRQVIAGSLSVGALLAFANYVDKIYQPINGLAGLYSETQKTVPAMERVIAVLDVMPEFNTFKGQRLNLESVQGRVELNSVGFGYSKDRPVTKNVNLAIEPGSKVAIVGPSGCGKTTLAHLLMRFFDVNSGSIKLDGINIKQINIRDYRKHVGLIPQGVRLFGGTIRDNILMGNRRASEDEMVQAAKASHAHEFISRLPDLLVSDIHTLLSVKLCVKRAFLY